MSAQVLISSATPRVTLYALLGPNGAVTSEAYGGWNAVPRPRRSGVVIWEGRKPFRLTVQIVFDEFRTDGSVEPQCNKLEKLALPVAKGEEPPIVNIKGDGIPVGENTDWVINDIQWEDVIRNDNGKRSRQVATIDLYEYTEITRLREDKASAKARGKAASSRKKKQLVKGKSKAHPSTYVVKAGDSLSSIAAHQLGSATKWHEIADLNNIRDPKAIKVGQRLKLP